MTTRDPISLRKLRRRAAVTSFFLAANAALGFISLVPATQPFFEIDIEAASGDTVVAWFAAVAGILFIAITTVVAFLLWLHRAATNLRELEPERQFLHTPGWCVGWWFVPFANLVKPAYAVHEIWHWSRVDARERTFDVGKNIPALVAFWWAAWIGSKVLDKIAERATEPAWPTLAVVVNMAAATLCILVVREITTQQAARYQARQEMPLGEGMGHVPLSGDRR